MRMNRKQLEMALSQVASFQKPNVELEQYQTPPNVAANIVHAAYMNGDIQNKDVVDICAGTGILGIAGGLLGAKSITFVEKDKQAAKILKSNLQELHLDEVATVLVTDALNWKSKRKYATAILNPPFGIQQQIVRDTEFLRVALRISNTVYSIHDGSAANEEYLPEFVRKSGGRPLGFFRETFNIPKIYSFHTDSVRQIAVIVLRALSA